MRFLEVLLILMLIGCDGPHPTELKESEFSATEGAQSSSDDRRQFDGGRYVKSEGWDFPIPKKRKELRRKSGTLATEDGGTVNMIITDFEPKSEIEFRLDFEKGDAPKDYLSGRLKVEMFRESKINGHIFWYTLFLRRLDKEAPRIIGGPQGSLLVIRVLDLDGDERFETLITDSSEVTAPKWVLN